MNVLDLFAGPGGWDVAAHLLGLNPLGVEWDTAACATAQAAGHRRLQADVAELDPHTVAGDTDVDLLIASPPCQAFSMAGKGKGRKGAQVILDGVDAIGSGRDPRQVCADVDNQLDDPRAALVLEPLRWALDLEPTYLAWEQVPAVLPLWEAMAEVLRADGWSVATGNLQAEQYDTPQTRKRAILVASRVHEVSLPAAVRRKYRKGISQDGAIKGQEHLEPWLSMADALGWYAAPGDMSVTSMGTPKVDGRNGTHELDPSARPAHTVTTKVGEWSLRSNYGTGGDASNRGQRTGDEPAPTVTSHVDRNLWQYVNGNQANSARPDIDQPAPTVHFAERQRVVEWHMAQAGATSTMVDPRPVGSPAGTITGKGTAAWTHGRPVTTVQGDPRLPAPGHRCMTADCHPGQAPESMMAKSIRVTVQEAALLQGFPGSGYYRLEVEEMTRDELAAGILAAGFVTVDHDTGRVFRHRGPGGLVTEPIEVSGNNVNGYLAATFRLGETRKQIRLHRLVWISANGVIDEDMVVDHINNDKTDNRLQNLQLLTSRDNSVKAHADGLYMNRSAVPRSGHEAIAFANVVAGVTQQRLADHYGVTRGRIGQIVRECGYPWQGTKTPQYRQVGDAVPPPLAWHVLRAALGMPVESYPTIADSPRTRQEPAA